MLPDGTILQEPSRTVTCAGRLVLTDVEAGVRLVLRLFRSEGAVWGDFAAEAVLGERE